MSALPSPTPLLELRDAHVSFALPGRVWPRRPAAHVRAVDGVSLTVGRGEILGLVGESGCGKSTVARAIIGLVPLDSGQLLLEGQDLTASATRAKTRRAVQMVFQDPFASLNPRLSVGEALAEPLRVHRLRSPDRIGQRVSELADLVGLSERALVKYPHEFSGGQRQRIAIARALAMEPRLIVADEPVSALDVSIQAQILNLLGRLVRELDLGLLFIAHDLSVVRHISDRVAVMYMGRVVEQGAADAVICRPAHPYARALVASAPRLDPGDESLPAPLAGDPPSPLRPPSGCAFHPRCVHAIDACRATRPALTVSADRDVACLRANDPGLTV